MTRNEKEENNMKKTIAGLIGAVILSGCGVMQNSINTEDSYKEKAALALGTNVENIKISNQTASLDSISFIAERVDNNSFYKCSYTTALVVESDALCSKTTEPKEEVKEVNEQCNALQQAANQC